MVPGDVAATGGQARTGTEASASIRASVLASVAGKAAEMVTLLVLATVVPRALGPSDYGRFSVPLTVVTLGSLALTLGGPTLMARYVPAASAADRVALARAIGARLARGRAAQVGLLAVAAASLALAEPDAFPPLVTSLVVAALGLNVAATLGLQVALGLGRTGAWSARYPMQNTVLIAAVLLLQPAAGDTGAVLSILVAAMAGACFAAVMVAPIVRQPVPRVAIPEGAIRFGTLHATGAALVQFSHRGAVLAVALLAGSAAETGYAALATGIALGVTYAVLQLFTVSLTHLAGGDASDRTAEAVLRRLARWLLAAVVPVALMGALVLDRAVPAIFGEGYEGAASAFGPALALIVLAPLNGLALQAAALRLQPGVTAMAGAASATVFVVTAIVAVPAWGAAGGVAAALAGATASALVSLWQLPGAIGGGITAASFAGAGCVLPVASFVT